MIARALVLVKLLHTAIWIVMVAAIAGIYLFSAAGRFGWALTAIVLIAAEVVVLVANRWQCPLTPVAGRYTSDRAPNFDIYLPEGLARYNKEIFGTLYAGGLAYALIEWLRRP